MENQTTGKEHRQEGICLLPGQKDMADALRKAQERLDLIYRNTSVRTWDYSIKERRITLRGSSAHMHGFDPAVDNVPERLVESGFIHPDSVKAFCEMYEKLSAGEPRAEGVFRVRTADRASFGYVHICYTVLFDENGQPDVALGISTDVSQEIELKKKAETDSLTGLLSHSAYMEQAAQMLRGSNVESAFFLLFDLDNFKVVNDVYGHMMGDIVLTRIGRLFSKMLQQSGKQSVCGRLGGDEFAMLVCGVDRAFTEALAEDVLAGVAIPGADGVPQTVSIGISEFPKDADNLDGLYRFADRALYSAKRNGKSRSCFYGEHHETESLVNARRKFLADTTPGGMMGGYIEEGFPFYFIDDGMLRWLGYGSEEEFVRDIDGLVDNCIHPDDRAYVDQEVTRQLSSGNRYTVDYRIRKKDGSYFWVHDIGERTTAPDGRPAITSVCYDITREKEHNRLIDRLMDGLNARVALYRVEKGERLTLLHASENTMEATGYSNEEYWEFCKNDAVDFVYPPDRSQVRSTIRKAVEDDAVVTASFRLCNKGGGFTWITGVFSLLESDQGRPVIRIIFMPFSIQNDLQLQMLDSKYIGVYVIDEETEELYFANNTVLDMYGVPNAGTAGRTCHDVFYQSGSTCKNCWRKAANAGDAVLQEHAGRVFSMEMQRRTWNGRNIAVVYCRDVTEQFRLQKQREELFDNIPAGLSLFSVKDEKITPVFFSSTLERAFGIDTEKILKEEDAQAFFSCVHPDDLPQLMTRLREDVKAPCADRFYRYRCWNAKQGRYIWIELHANMVRHGDEIQVYSTYNDITSANRMQERLEENQRAMEAVVHYGGLGIWSYDLDSRELKMEYLGENSYGYETTQGNIPDAYIERGHIYHEDADVYRQCYERILAGAPVSECTVRIRNQNTRQFLWMHVYLIRQKDTLDGRRRALGFAFVVDNEIKSVKALETATLELQAANERFEMACAFANFWIFNVDIETSTVYVSKKLQQEFGFLPQADNFPECLLAHHLVLPEYEKILRENFSALSQGAEQVTFDVQSLLSDGKVHWLRFQAQVMKTPDPGRRNAVVSVQQIDTEKAMKARLELERQKQQKDIENLLFYYVGNITKNTVVEYKSLAGRASPDVKKMTLDHFMKAGYSRLTYRSDREKAAQIYERDRLLQFYQNGTLSEQYHAQMPLPDGHVCMTRHQIQLLADPDTGDVYLYEYVYDVSREQLADLLMKHELNNRYDAVGLWIVAVDQFTVWSYGKDGSRREETMHYEEYIRKYSQEHVHPEDRDRFYSHYIKPDLTGGADADNEIIYRVVEDGNIRYLKAALQVLYNDDDKCTCILTRQDLTDLMHEEEEKRRALEYALEKAKVATQAKTDFLSRMSHELRTPLNAILGMVHLTADEVTDHPLAAEYIHEIEESSRYLLGIINDILEMSRIENGNAPLQPDWHTSAEVTLPVLHMIEPMMTAKGIHFERPLGPYGSPNVEYYMDLQKTQQMLMNLLNNACKFTPAGGTVTLRTYNISLDRSACTGTDKTVVEDTGCGMSEEFLKRIFHPFEQEQLPGMENIPGTGLGLAISRSIAQQMGGDIEVQSEVGKGSRFIVTFSYRYRVRENAEAPPESALPTPAETLDGKRILLAEDNELNAMIAAKLLEKQGASVDWVENGSLAVQCVADAPEGTYDLVLMDVRMPVMDGLEATRRIRALNRPDAKALPILAMSANAYETDRQASLQAGMNAHLSKPVEPKLLYQTIRKYLAP